MKRRALERRIYTREFRQLLGWGPTWFCEQKKRGVIPAPRRDPGSQRDFWTESEVAGTMERLNAAAIRTSVPA